MPAKNLLKTNESLIATFAARSALLMAGNLVRLAVQLTVLILYSRWLPVEAYGKYQSVWLFINVFGVITLFGLPTLLLSAGEKNIAGWIKQKGSLFFTIAVILHLLPAVYLVAVNNFDLNTCILLYAFLLAQNFSIVRETLAVKHNRQVRLFIVQVVFNTGWLLCHWLVIKNNYSLPLLISALLVLSLLKAALLPSYGKQVPFENAPLSTGRQWMFLGFFDVVGVLFKWIDKWVILLFVSVHQFAIYFNGAYEIPVFPLLVSAAGSIMIVDLSKGKDIGIHAPALFRKCMRYLAIPVIPSFFLLLFYHENIFLLIFGDKYAEAVPVFLASIFVIPARICHYTAALQAMHRNDIVVRGAFLDLALAILLLCILYPAFGLPGLALAFVLSTWAQAAYYLFQTARLTHNPLSAFIPYRYLALLILVSATTIFSGKRFLSNAPWHSLVTGLIFCVLIIGCFSTIAFVRKKKML